MVIGYTLVSGRSTRCRSCVIRSIATTHGGFGTRLYECWDHMKQRCHNSNYPGFKDYGERGILVCPEWRESFVVFRDWALSNGFAEGLEIDRIDVDKGYQPDNCRWVTELIQARNKRNTRWLTAFGETKRLVEWVEDCRCVVTYRSLNHRIRRGMSPEDALTRPMRT